MEKEEILKQLAAQATDPKLRDNISQIAQKLIAYGIDLTVPLDADAAKPDINVNLVAIKDMLAIEANDEQLLLQAIVDFYFANVKQAFP